MNKILVTGGSGFVGSYLVPLLEERGLLIDNYDIKNNDDIFDTTNLINRMKDCDAVIHLAAIPHYKINRKMVPKEQMFQMNFEGTKNVVECCKNAGIKRLVFTSSGAVYGYDEQITPTNEFPIPINALPPYEKLNLYAQSKISCEKYLSEKATEGLSIVVLRINGIRGVKTCSPLHFFHHAEQQTQATAYYNALFAEVDQYEIFNVCEKEIPENTGKWVKEHYPNANIKIHNNESLIYNTNTIKTLKI
jgi:2-alkyl-3-oxoalkanoate reductase